MADLSHLPPPAGFKPIPPSLPPEPDDQPVGLLGQPSVLPLTSHFSPGQTTVIPFIPPSVKAFGAAPSAMTAINQVMARLNKQDDEKAAVRSPLFDTKHKLLLAASGLTLLGLKGYDLYKHLQTDKVKTENLRRRAERNEGKPETTDKEKKVMKPNAKAAAISVLDPSSTGTAGAVGGGLAGAALGALGGGAYGALSSDKGKRRKGALTGALWGAGLGGLGGGLAGHNVGKGVGQAAHDLVFNEAVSDSGTAGVLSSIRDKMNDRKFVRWLVDDAMIREPNEKIQERLADDKPGRWIGGMNNPVGGHGPDMMRNLVDNKAIKRYQLPLGQIPTFLKDPSGYAATNWDKPFKADMLEEAQAKGPTADQVSALVKAYQGK